MKTVSFEEQIMSIVPIFLHKMEAVVLIIFQMFFATDAVL